MAKSGKGSEVFQPCLPDEANEPGNQNRVLPSLTDDYELTELLSKGTFGFVYKATARLANRTVAVKILRKRHQYMAEREFAACLMVSGTAPFIEVFEYFHYRERPCLVFELLEVDLLHYITKHGALPLVKVRNFIRQILEGLKILKENQIVHGDIKPSNIMLKNIRAHDAQLKIIDLGGTLTLEECKRLVDFQTLHFRAPEVIIQSACNEKVDMWSAGCVLAEMLLGRRLYPGTVETDQLIMITLCQGPVPGSVLARGRNTRKYYDFTPTKGYKLKGNEDGLVPRSWDTTRPYFTFNVKSLEDAVMRRKRTGTDEKEQLLCLLSSMLSKNPKARSKPEEALAHFFFKTELFRNAGARNKKPPGSVSSIMSSSTYCD